MRGMAEVPMPRPRGDAPMARPPKGKPETWRMKDQG